MSALLTGVVMLVPLSLPTAAAAQETAPHLDSPKPLIVTARKRAETDISVPISTGLIDDHQLQDIARTNGNADLARTVPNLTFVQAGAQASNLFNIRSIGSFSPIAADDSSVMLYADEAPLSIYGIAPTLLDVERVEVLRGPQGTLYGRNSQGGAINILSRRPTFAPSLSLTGEIGDHGYHFTEAVANIPLIADRLAVRVAANYTRFGGDIPNLLLGGKDGSSRIGSFRGSLLYTPDTRTEILFRGSYQHYDDSIPRWLLRDTADYPASGASPRQSGVRNGHSYNLKIHHDFGSLIFESVTSYQRIRNDQSQDLTDALIFSKLFGRPQSAFNNPAVDLLSVAMGERTWLQEMRLSSVTESAIQWTAGVNYYHSRSDFDASATSSTPIFAGSTGIRDNDFRNRSYAVFGEATVPLTARLKATFGLRGTHEDKSGAYRYTGIGTPGTVASFRYDSDLKDAFMTGRAALSYDWSGAFMTYVSVGRGYVTGGFPANSVNSPIGKPEVTFPASKSWTYEGGFKARLLDGHIDLTGAFFYNDVRRGHLFTFNAPTASFTVAALDYRSYGGELQARAQLVGGLSLLGGIGVTISELRNVPVGSATGARSGNRVPNVPKLTANAGLNYQRSAAALGLPGDLYARGLYQHVGERQADVANSFTLAAYNIVNGRIGWKRGGIDLYLFANNLFDTRYQATGQRFATVPTVLVGQGRVAGLGAALTF